MIIREAMEYDAFNIARVNVEGWRSAYKDIMPGEYLSRKSIETSMGAWLRNIKEKRSQIMVAEYDGEVRGFISGGAGTDELFSYESEIYALYVDEEFRGKGIGFALMKAFWTERLALGFSNCAVWTLELNPYRRFYEKAGGLLLPLKKEGDFGGRKLAEAAYAWQNIRI